MPDKAELVPVGRCYMLPLAIVLTLVGIGAGFGGSTVLTKKKMGSAEDAADKELKKAKKEADEQLRRARDDAAEIAETARKDEQTRRREIKEIENRLLAREESIDKKLDTLDKRAEALRKNEVEVEELKDEIRAIRTKQQEKLEKVAKLTKEKFSHHFYYSV